MADSGLVFPPGWRLTDASNAVVALGTIEVTQAGSSTPTNVYSDATLSTSLGSTIYVDSGGYPVASQGSSTKVAVYAGDSLIKLIAKDADGNTLWTHDNVKVCEDHSTYLTSTDLEIPTELLAETTYIVTSDDYSKLKVLGTSGGNVTANLPAADDAGNGTIVILGRDGSSNDLTIAPDGSDTINGASSLDLVADGDVAWLVSDGASNWYVLAYVPGYLLGSRITQVMLDDGFLIPAAPQGRLTLTSATPVTTSDVTGATAIYYTAHNGDTVPVYDSTLGRFVSKAITGGEMTLTLAAQHTADTLYDVFVFVDNVTLTIGTGPAWSNSTAGSSSRGTGAGTTQLTATKGLYTNTVSMTARNGSSTYSVAAGAATYLGTFRTTGSNGQTEDSLTKRFISNGYNAVPRSMVKTDATASWSYGTASWRALNNSTANAVNCVVGLARAALDVTSTAVVSNTGGTTTIGVGIGIDSTSANSALVSGGTRASGGYMTMARYMGLPAVGYHTVTALEYSESGATWYGTAAAQLTGIAGTIMG